MAALPVNSSLAFDTRALDALRSRAASDPKAAVRETARQFEALFMQELMKSMRSTTLAAGISVAWATPAQARSWAPKCSIPSTPVS